MNNSKTTLVLAAREPASTIIVSTTALSFLSISILEAEVEAAQNVNTGIAELPRHGVSPVTDVV